MGFKFAEIKEIAVDGKVHKMAFKTILWTLLAEKEGFEPSRSF